MSTLPESVLIKTFRRQRPSCLMTRQSLLQWVVFEETDTVHFEHCAK